MFLEINGKRVEVDDSFKNLPTDQQQAAVDHIAASINQKPEAAVAPANSTAGTHPYGDPIGGAALGAAVGASPNLIGKSAGIVGDVAKAAINSVKGTPPSVAPPPPSSLDAKLNTNLDKGTWEPPKFTPKGMPVDPNVPSDVYNWHIGQHADVPVRGTNQLEAERLAQEWKAKQDAKAAFEKANPGKTLTESGLVVSVEDAAKIAQQETAKKQAELLEWRIKQQAAEKIAEKTATAGERLGTAANIGKKLPVAGALGVANVTDLSNRLHNEQYPEAVVSGAGTVGSLLPFVKGVSDKVKLGGTAGAVAAPFINMAIEGKAPSKEDVAMGALGLVGGPFIQGMMPGTVQAATLDNPKNQGVYEEGQTDILKDTKLPKYAEGGDVKKPSAGIAGVYNQVGPVQGPSLSSIWAEHLASLPEKTAQNIMNTNTMVQNSMPYSFDPKKPLFDPNPNYDPQAAKDFNDYASNFMGITEPAKISQLMELIKQRGGTEAVKRLERAADLVPNLENKFQPQALKSAFTGDNASAVMVMKPGDFEKYAMPIDPTHKGYRIGDVYAGNHNELPKGDLDEYLKYLNSVKESGGFRDVPFLNVGQLQGHSFPNIQGHEGRHRMRALEQANEENGLVRMIPTPNLREPFPRRSQEEYLNALQEKIGIKPMVKPEQTEEGVSRGLIDLPQLFKKGGKV